MSRMCVQKEKGECTVRLGRAQSTGRAGTRPPWPKGHIRRRWPIPYLDTNENDVLPVSRLSQASPPWIRNWPWTRPPSIVPDVLHIQFEDPHWPTRSPERTDLRVHGRRQVEFVVPHMRAILIPDEPRRRLESFARMTWPVVLLSY